MYSSLEDSYVSMIPQEELELDNRIADIEKSLFEWTSVDRETNYENTETWLAVATGVYGFFKQRYGRLEVLTDIAMSKNYSDMRKSTESVGGKFVAAHATREVELEYAEQRYFVKFYKSGYERAEQVINTLKHLMKRQEIKGGYNG